MAFTSPFVTSSRKSQEHLYMNWLCFGVSGRSGFTRMNHVAAEFELKKEKKIPLLVSSKIKIV